MDIRFTCIVLTGSLLLAGCSREAADVGETPVVAMPSPGEQVFTQNCKVCHAQGINGAPIIGNKKMWAPRVEKGIPELVQHAMNGFGLMPAKGGNASLTEADITQAVSYMVSRATEQHK